MTRTAGSRRLIVVLELDEGRIRHGRQLNLMFRDQQALSVLDLLVSLFVMGAGVGLPAMLMTCDLARILSTAQS